MEKARARRIRTERHRDTLAVAAYRRTPGTQAQKAEARGVAPGTVGHYHTDRPDPALAEILERLIAGLSIQGVSPTALLEAVEEAYELHWLASADDEVLIRRGVTLMQTENEVGYKEDVASLTGNGHSEWLRKVADASRELAMTIDELMYRGIDLHQRYREAMA